MILYWKYFQFIVCEHSLQPVKDVSCKKGAICQRHTEKPPSSLSQSTVYTIQTADNDLFSVTTVTEGPLCLQLNGQHRKRSHDINDLATTRMSEGINIKVATKYASIMRHTAGKCVLPIIIPPIIPVTSCNIILLPLPTCFFYSNDGSVSISLSRNACVERVLKMLEMKPFFNGSNNILLNFSACFSEDLLRNDRFILTLYVLEEECVCPYSILQCCRHYQ